jgi:hypothetical protein
VFNCNCFDAVAVVVVAVIVAAFAVDIVVGQILLVICRLVVYLLLYCCVRV